VIIMLRRSKAFMAVLSVAISIFAAAPAALAQTYSANGQIGYLQEWEMKASLVKTMTSAGTGYSGPVTLRHVGLCSADGVEEKSGVVKLEVSPKTLGIEGTLSMKDDDCRIVASASRLYSGLLSCHDGQGIPISFSIEQMSSRDQAGLPGEK
jgi:hypothetical protein